YAAAVSFGTNACWQGQSGSAALGGAAWTLAATTSVAAIEIIGKTCLADTPLLRGAARHQAPCPVVAIGREGQENRRRRNQNDCRGRFELAVESKADQLDRVSERVDRADIVKEETRLLDVPQRVKRGGGKEHRKDHEIHHAGEVFELAD